MISTFTKAWETIKCIRGRQSEINFLLKFWLLCRNRTGKWTSCPQVSSNKKVNILVRIQTDSSLSEECGWSLVPVVYGQCIRESVTAQHFSANSHRHNIVLTKSKQSRFKAKCSRLSTVAVLSVSPSCRWASNAAIGVIPTIVYISKESAML